ncbi:MAG: hypothetical protein AAGI38_18595 [Bacteroidota bacterium]
MKTRLIALSMMILGTISFATAQVTPGATKTQVRQQARIQQGVRTGELNRRETRQLQRQQANIRRTKRRAKADGVVTPAERRDIKSKQRRANRTIRRKKNNGV